MSKSSFQTWPVGWLLFLLILLAAPATRAQLPFDPSTIDQLTPAQRQRAMQLLGQPDGTVLPSPDGSFSDAGLNATAPPANAATPVSPGGTSMPLSGTPPVTDLTSHAVNAASSPAVPGHPNDQTADRKAQLQPFGYDLFTGAATTFAPATDIPIPSDYVLGPGDTLRIQLYGSDNGNYTLQVGRDGQINFPKLGPISVAGQRFDEVRSRLSERVAREMIGVQASISLGELRSVQVFLLGDVNQPGAYTVSSLSTITNVLFVGGGISPTGSLRHVRLKRDGRLVRELDLYDLLLHGDSSADERILPGDVIFVPPVGPRVAIAGEVKRPAIYEIDGERTVAQVLAMAGGLQAEGNTGVARLKRYQDNQRQIRQLDLSRRADLALVVRDGDALEVGSVSALTDNQVQVGGFVKYPGAYQWRGNDTLHDLLLTAVVKPSDAKAQAYLPLGLIERTDPLSGARNWSAFDVTRQLADDAPVIPLQRQDLVLILTRRDVAYLDSREVRAVAKGGDGASCPALQALARLVRSDHTIRFLTMFGGAEQPEDEAAGHDGLAAFGCPALYHDNPSVLSFLLQLAVALNGEVQQPGLYPIVPGTALSMLVKAAGGLTTEGDPANIEYLSYAQALKAGHADYQTLDLGKPADRGRGIDPGDLVTIKPVYTGQEAGSIRLLGEFRFPGSYSIQRGEHLSDVIHRAGGITPTAYPYGAVFTRLAAQRAEAASYQREAKDLQEAAVTAVTSGALGKDAQVSSEFLNAVALRLRTAKPVGRVVIEADPVMLEAKPQLDPLVEPGDLLVMPKRPISVTVIGQVLNPGSLAFRPGTSVADYIVQAGGYGQAADEGRVFVILPNGTARKFKTSFWNFEARDVPPGSVIVVPRDATPFNALAFGERIFGILSNLAVSTAALVTISRF